MPADVPYRQWVLSFPRWVRLRRALDAKLLTRALAIVLRTFFAWQRKKARALGWCRSRTAAVTFVRRFSSALRLNVHFPCLVPDGVFAIEPDPATARSRFLRLAAPTNEEVEAINVSAARKIIAALRAGDCDRDTNLADTRALGTACAAALQPPLRGFAGESMRRGRRCSNVDGFSLPTALARQPPSCSLASILAAAIRVGYALGGAHATFGGMTMQRLLLLILGVGALSGCIVVEPKPFDPGPGVPPRADVAGEPTLSLGPTAYPGYRVLAGASAGPPAGDIDYVATK